MKVCYVTMFFDIGREMWDNSFNRNFDVYLDRFTDLIKLFIPNENNKKYIA